MICKEGIAATMDGTLNPSREVQYLMPPGMRVRSGSIMRRRSSARKKSSVSFAMDVPVDRRGSFRTSVKRRMSISRRSYNSGKSDSGAVVLVGKGSSEPKQTWKCRAFGEKNYLALKKLAIVLQDKRDNTPKKGINFHTWSEKQQQKRQLEVESETVRNGDKIENCLVKNKLNSGSDLLVVLKKEGKGKWVKVVLNGMFLVTGISLLASVLIVIMYTSFVKGDAAKYHYQHFSSRRKQYGFSSRDDNQSPVQVPSKLNVTSNNGNSSHLFSGSRQNMKTPCVGVPLTLGNNPVIISLLCSSMSSIKDSSSSSSPPPWSSTR